MRSQIKPPPKLVLTSADELLAFLTNPPLSRETWPDAFEIKSDFLMECIKEISAAGQYPYNERVYTLACERLGLPAHDYHGSPKSEWLDQLVYCAQRYKVSDEQEARLIELKARGFEPLTQELVERAFSESKHLEFADGKRATVRTVDNKTYAFLPRKCRYALRPNGVMVRVVAA